MSNTPKARRQARLRRQEERLRALNYYARQSGTFGLNDIEHGEREHLRAVIDRAKAAQQQHERRVDVQLEMVA